MNSQTEESSHQMIKSNASQERHKSILTENLKAKDCLRKRALSPGIERSSLASNNRLFSETTAESFNMMNHLSTISSPNCKSRPNFKEFKTMLNINSTLDSSKQSLTNKKKTISFMNGGNIEEVDDSSKMIINPKVMEVWLNDILEEAQQLDLKSCYLKPGKQKPISMYGIDRQALGKYGLNTELINRVYRGLFVYSVGFFELLKKCTLHAKSNTSLAATIWRVYAILLEYCCKTDYNMMISEVSKNSLEEIQRLQNQIEQNQLAFQEKEK